MTNLPLYRPLIRSLTPASPGLIVSRTAGDPLMTTTWPRLGMFLMPVHDPAKPLAQCLDEDLELVVKCEELGFDEFWVGEHHTSSVDNIVMPEIFIARALGL